MIIKLLANESFCNTTPNNFLFSTQMTQNANYGGGNTGTLSGVNTYSSNNTGATVLRLFNSGATASLLTVSVNSTVNVASVTIAANQEMFLVKQPAQFLQSNLATGVFCVPVAFKSV